MTTENGLPDGDYVLAEGAAWFTVKGLSVRIYTTEEGVACDVYRLGAEDEPSLASMFTLFPER